MKKNKIKNKNQCNGFGMTRIDEIKVKINSYSSPKICKAEVYETWQNIFEPEE